MRKPDTNTIVFLILADLLVTLVAFFTAVQARYWLPFGVQLTWDEVAQPWVMYVLVALIWGVTFTLMQVYDQRYTARTSTEAQVLAWAIGVAYLVFAGVLYLTYRELPRRLFFYFIVSNLTLLIGLRVALRSALLFAGRQNVAALTVSERNRRGNRRHRLGEAAYARRRGGPERRSGVRVVRDQIDAEAMPGRESGQSYCVGAGVVDPIQQYILQCHTRVLPFLVVAHGREHGAERMAAVHRHDARSRLVGRCIKGECEPYPDAFIRQPPDAVGQPDSRHGDPPVPQARSLIVLHETQHADQGIDVRQRLSHSHEDDVVPGGRISLAEEPAHSHHLGEDLAG